MVSDAFGKSRIIGLKLQVRALIDDKLGSLGKPQQTVHHDKLFFADT